MQTILNIFLGSSIVELKKEREAIKSMITDINSKLRKKNILIYLYACEQKDLIYKGYRSQDELNDDVRKSDYSIFIIGKSLGEKTKEEFNIALDGFNKNNKPQIMVMFKKIPEYEKDHSVIYFQKELAEKYEYYYEQYETESDAAAIVASLINSISGELLVSQSDGVYIDGEKLYDYDREINNNKQVNEIKTKINTLENKIKLDNTNEELKIELSNYQKKLFFLTNSINNILLSLADSVGFGVTNEYKKAVDFIKGGDTILAKSTLEYNSILRHKEYIDNILELRKTLINSVNALIKENNLLIKLKALERIDDLEIRKLYEENIALENYAGIEPISEYNYGDYLFGVTDYYKAFNHIYSYFSYLYYAKGQNNQKLYEMAKTILRLGTIYSHIFQFNDAKYCYSTSVKIHEELAKENAKLYILQRADSYNKLGNVCDDLKDYNLGEFYHNKAIELYKESYDDYKECKYELGYSYNKQGNIFRHKALEEKNNNLFDEANKDFEKALYYYNLNKSFTLENLMDSRKKKETLGINEKSIGLTYHSMGDYNEAIKHFNNSLEYFEESVSKKVLYVCFQYAKVLYHKSMSLYLSSPEDIDIKDDIRDYLCDGQKYLLELYEKKINLREVLFELSRNYSLLYSIRKNNKYIEIKEKYDNELKELSSNKLFSISTRLY